MCLSVAVGAVSVRRVRENVGEGSGGRWSRKSVQSHTAPSVVDINWLMASEWPI